MNWETRGLQSAAVGALLLLATVSASRVDAQIAAPQAIYGADSRYEVFRAGPERRRLARSTVALVKGDPSLAGGETRLEAPTLGQAENLCPGQRFADQIVPAFCSGALVAPDVVLTAGHCFRDTGLDQTLFVFDFRALPDGSVRTVFPGSSVYAGKRLIKRIENDRRDYALIRLDRKVTGREPLRLASTNTVGAGTQLFVIGHPDGLPAKIAGRARVTQVDRTKLAANLDTFEGNSGSPVFDVRSNQIVGVLDEGQEDYVQQGDCFVPRRFPNQPGGEVATLSAAIAAELARLR